MPKIEQTIADVNVRAHTFKFITPAESDALKIPNACNLCHADKTTAWATDVLKGWRDRFTKLAEDDQTRATFEGLKPSLLSLPPFTKEEARDWVKGQMREVLSKMGSGAAE